MCSADVVEVEERGGDLGPWGPGNSRIIKVKPAGCIEAGMNGINDSGGS
jgi:hypothetical protein